MSPDERAEIVKRAMPDSDLDATQLVHLAEVLYTMSESEEVPHALDTDLAVRVWALVELVRRDKYSEDMRL